jgi:hypothetical protein
VVKMHGDCAHLYTGSWAAGSRAVVSDASTSALSPARELRSIFRALWDFTAARRSEMHN